MDLVNWRKSSHSGSTGDCVEVAFVPGLVGVRDTKSRDIGTLHFPESTWHLLTGALDR
jgi:hypothetical protein